MEEENQDKVQTFNQEQPSQYQNPYQTETPSNMVPPYQQNVQQSNMQNNTPAQNDAGHGVAVASLVLGIIGTVFCFFGVGAFISIILGIIGLVCAANAKNEGNTEGTRTAGFVLSIISLVGGAIVFLASIVLLGAIASIASLD